MSPARMYALWRAQQHEDIALAADHAFTAFLAEISFAVAHLDVEPATDIESRHYGRIRNAA